MKAGKAYISSLGTTGLLIASSLLLLLVVGTLVAFDRWPEDEGARADDVAVGAERAVEARPDSDRQTRARARARGRARAERRRAAATRRRQAREAPSTDATETSSGTVLDPVISNLPAPVADGSAGPGAGTGSAAGGSPGGGGGSGNGGETTRQLGDAVSNVSPDLGIAIGGVGGALDEAVPTEAPSLLP